MNNLKIIIDNNSNINRPELLTEHGLSIYFEDDGKKWLCDVGDSDKFLHNASALGVNIAEIDYLVLSHGHKDHTGGLEYFLKNNDKAVIYASNKITNYKYYSLRHLNKRDISIKSELLDNSRFVPICGNTKISDNISLVYNNCSTYSKPIANKFLDIEDESGERLDIFDHEISILIKQGDGLAIISSCSHCGALNIMQSSCDFAQNNNLKMFVGGMHLLDDYEKEETLTEIVKVIEEKYPNILLLSGHCTGKKVSSMLKDKMGERYQEFYSGKALL